MMHVEKRDGSKEAFQQAKVERSVERAGGSKDVAKKIAMAVGKEVYDGIPTSEIRDLVIIQLDKQSRKAAAAFKTYKKEM